MSAPDGIVALVGFPTDSNSSFLRGPAKAPPLIRAELYSEGANPSTEAGVYLKGPGVLFDAGDAALGENGGDLAIIESTVGELLDGGRRVISLGGDHFVTYPIVRAFAARFDGLSIVHFDAHPDLYPIFEGNRYSHACPFARILEDTSVRNLVQIGIRTTSSSQREVAKRFGVRAFSPYEVDAAIDALPGGPVYVTIDLDGLDPAFAPGVSHREPGGLSVREVLATIRAIPGQIVGADVVELNPDRDNDGTTAVVAAKFVKELAGRIAGDARNRERN
jgi:agmatinase